MNDRATLRAIVLVGGEGTRLRPLTLTRPKQMLPILGITMLEHVLAHLREHGVREAVLALGYKPDVFLRAFPDGRAAGVRLHYAVESSPLDTAGAIRFAAAEAGFDGDRLLVANGDVETDLDIGALVSFHESNNAEATISLHQVDDPSAFGVVPTDGHGRVLAFVEKPTREDAPTDWINAGTYLLEPEALRRIPLGERRSIERVTFPAIAAEGRLYGFAWPGRWIDAGTPASYIRAQLALLEGGASFVGPGVRVDPSARVERSVIGRDGIIGPGAVVRDSVLLPRVVVGANATIEESALGEAVTVGDGACIRGLSVLGDGESVAAADTLDGVRRPS